MNDAASEIVSRLNMLGLKCDNVPLDRFSSPVGALACFPMFMVANVHGWSSDRQFKIPFLDWQGSEAVREAFAIGMEETRMKMDADHGKVVNSMLTARPSDRIIYEYALETLKQYLTIADPAVAKGIRTLVAESVVDVARASGKGPLGSGQKVSPQERECIGRIAEELRLSDSPARFDPIPSLGENTEPILHDLGYSEEEIQTLRDQKVI
jgi:hypothetical protein